MRIGDAEDVLGAGRHAGRGPYQGIEHSLIPGSLRRRRLPTHGRKGLGQPRIEDDARESGELLQALVHRGFCLEREVEGDIEESIDDRDDARLSRNRLTLEPIWVALTVEPLVVCADQWRQVGERRESCQQVRRHAWVHHHQRPLFRVQPAALLQDAVRQAELAQVLQQRRVAHPSPAHLVESEVLGEPLGEFGVFAGPAMERVAELDGPRERQHGRFLRLTRLDEQARGLQRRRRLVGKAMTAGRSAWRRRGPTTRMTPAALSPTTSGAAIIVLMWSSSLTRRAFAATAGMATAIRPTNSSASPM